MGRMIIQSAIDFNIDVHVLDPDAQAPCHAIATQFTQGDLQDFDAVYNFGKTCDLITIEIEKVNTEALKKLRDEGKKVYPQPEIVELIQDKRTQKQFYTDHKIPTAQYVNVENKADLQQHVGMLPAVHKLAKDGYDGRGVQVMRTEEDFEKGFDAPGLLEKLIDFRAEIAVIVARNESGEVTNYQPVELVFHPEANLVEYLFAPAQLDQAIIAKARSIATDLIIKLDMIGLLAVEMFVTKEGEVLVNEIAPRPHNSGHQTIEGNITSQFEQHLRAILNMPLGNVDLVTPSAMINLLGEEGHTGEAVIEGLEEALQTPGVHVHLYGKKTTKPYRKMGHVTVVCDNDQKLKSLARLVKGMIKIKAK